MTWRKLPVSLTELSIDTTLRCGQSFRWKRSEDGSTYSCALRGRLISLRQDATHLHYRATFPVPSEQKGKRKRHPPLTPKQQQAEPIVSGEDSADGETAALLRHYLHLGPDLGRLYEQWSTADQNFKKKAPRFTGVRILRQDAWEALVGFICSSNNNIARICQMMDKLCAHYGPLIGHVEEQPFYDMPPPEALAGSHVEGHLRELGFGYRAKYLHQTAVMITQGHKSWLEDLENPENPGYGRASAPAGEMQPGGRDGYRKAHESLLSLQGVGPKVADCVCLMGLGWGEAVPVDTHVWQIAQRDYKFGKGKHQSLTKATYDAVGDHFRKLWGKEAGWAHSVLFTADLRAFSERLTAKIEVPERPHALDSAPTGTAQVVDVKVEIASALPPEPETKAREEPLLTAAKTVTLDNLQETEVLKELKQEVAEEAMNLGKSFSERRRSKRQKRSI